MWQQFLISLLPGLIQMIAGKDSKVSNLASLFGQGYQTAQNYANQQENQAWQRNFAMQQFNYNSMLNDRSFFHSLPSSQIEHMKNAGLSPDLAYGQMSTMNYGNPVSVSMPTASSPNFAGLENSNLAKDLSKKDSDIGLNLSKTELNKVEKSLKDLEELYSSMTVSHRIDRERLQNEFIKINNQLQQSNVEENVINNMKLASSFGLIKSFDKDGNIVYSTTEKFREVTDLYLKDLKQKYDIGEQELKRVEKIVSKLDVEIKALNSEIMINSVAYQEDVLNLIATAISSGVSLEQNDKGEWIVDYDGDTGDKAGVVAMGLISTVLQVIGVRFGFSKNASNVMGKHENKSTINSNNTNTNTSKSINENHNYQH